MMPSQSRCAARFFAWSFTFNVYLNDMFDSVQADLYNFADDNNLSTVGNTNYK